MTNITTVAITDADLYARVPTLAQYRDPAEPDFSPQRLAAKAEAEARFNSAKGLDPARTVAVQDSAWKMVLVFATLMLIFEGDGTPKATELEDHYRSRYEGALQTFMYNYDADDSGEIDNTIEEAGQRAVEMVVVR